MKTFGKLHEIRYSQVKPGGWLKQALLEEKRGMPGNLDRIGYPFSTGFWKYKSLKEGDNTGMQWWPYEQSAYWIDGMVRAAGLLEDEELYHKVEEQIEMALGYEDSFIGPVELKEHERCYRWPIAVFARALYARWSLTGDERYLVKLRDHYLNDTSDYDGYRDVANVETMLRLYEYFGDKRLYEKAVAAYEKFDQSEEQYSSASAMSQETVPYQHGVTFNEQAKLAAIMYIYTGEERYLAAVQKGYEKIDRYHMLPDGVHTSCEFTEGNETKWAHETCAISDYIWAMGYLLEATASSRYADKIERAFLNAAFGAIGPYFKTFQYFSSVNQTIAARNSTNTCIKDFVHMPRMAYQPCHHPECCAGNITRVIPNYILRMYQKLDDGICVSLYGDSTFEDGDMTLVQTGGYPFGDKVTFHVKRKSSGEARLKLRIPYWAKDYTVTRNGKEFPAEVSDGYATITVTGGDTIELFFKKEFTSHESPDGGVYFEYGPFLLALKVDEKWENDRVEEKQTAEFPAYNVYAASAWNYCVTGQETSRIHMHEITDNPFWDGVPFEIEIDARSLRSWELVHEWLKKKVKKRDADKQNEKDVMVAEQKAAEEEAPIEHVTTPELPDADFIERNKGETVRITLIPYGCTNLRITVFPKYKSETI